MIRDTDRRASSTNLMFNKGSVSEKVGRLGKNIVVIKEEGGHMSMDVRREEVREGGENG